MQVPRYYLKRKNRVILPVVLLGTLFFSGCILSQVYAAEQLTLEEKLAAYKWKSRVLLIISTAQHEKKAEQQKAMLESEMTETEERDIKVLYLTLNGMTNEDKVFVQQTFNIKNQDFCVILIGKDGGEKMRSISPIQMENLFQTIDKMLMRQQEIKAKMIKK